MRYDYERFFEEKLRELALEPRVIDIGGGEPFQKGMRRFRHIFAQTLYQTVDSSSAYNPTFVGDAHNLPFADNEIPAILCNSVFEHLTDPRRAASEIHRVLRPGGKALVYTHFIYPYHARPGVYGDYFRFTDEGLRHLFREFSSVEIKKQGGYFHALMFFLPYQHRLKSVVRPVACILDAIFGRGRGTTVSGYYLYAVK